MVAQDDTGTSIKNQTSHSIATSLFTADVVSSNTTILIQVGYTACILIL